jgi:MoxR-like ATPase
VITASTCSSETVRGRPGRGSSNNPSSRSVTNRDRHLRALLNAIPSRSAIAVVLNPSAAASTIRDRTASAFALFARRDQATNCARSPSESSTTGATGLGTSQAY